MCINTPKIQHRDTVIEKRYCHLCGKPFITMFNITICIDCLREEEADYEREYNKLNGID